jgi:hypothetical protein
MRCHGHNREWSRNHPFEYFARMDHGDSGNDSALIHCTPHVRWRTIWTASATERHKVKALTKGLPLM